ncbi:MAG: SAM-dependent methyltransferase [Alphaproteobacteria bacterium]|nr:SAM-dependent methyltransferase [Alphaproteobacteria bacterium]
MPYDQNQRRQTPLLEKLKARIGKQGPMSIDKYMRCCLTDPDYGYYRTGTVLGRAGDFITAPEISQTFGELIGLWCVAIWQQMGTPQHVHLIELGGGRGTLLADALRAAAKASTFIDAVSVSIMESHPELRRQQAKALQAYAPRVNWPGELFELDDAPAIMIANEFLDCLPIEQFVATPDTHPGWQRQRVGLDEHDQLQFMLGRFEPPSHAGLPPELTALSKSLSDVSAGDIIETRNLIGCELNNLKDFVFGPDDQRPFAGLFVDYGHTTTQMGDTLQAVRRHAYEHPLASPGEADLTAQVDFAQFAHQMSAAGFAIDGPATQGEFLGRLGIVERASRLMAQNPKQAAALESSVARLISPSGMGGRFHALAIRSPGLAPLPGLSS